MLEWIYGLLGYENSLENNFDGKLDKIKQKIAVRRIEIFYLKSKQKKIKKKIRAKRRHLYRRLNRTNPNLHNYLKTNKCRN